MMVLGGSLLSIRGKWPTPSVEIDFLYPGHLGQVRGGEVHQSPLGGALIGRRALT